MKYVCDILSDRAELDGIDFSAVSYKKEYNNYWQNIKKDKIKQAEQECDEKLFKQVVKTSFNQRRKTLRNSMKPLLGKDCPDFSLPIFDKRPEQLSVEQFIELTLITEKNLS